MSVRLACILAAVLGFTLGPGSVLAQVQRALRQDGPMHARPRLVPERQTVMPGEDVLVAIDFEIDDGWHTYWQGQNDTGFAMHAKVTCSPNAECGELLWPAPHRYSPSEGILDHVFEHRMTVLLPVHVADDARLGDVIDLRIAMRWLVCEAICLPESADLTLNLPIAEGASKPDRDTSAMFDAARARLPRPPTPEDHVQLSMAGETLSVRIPGASHLAFYPLEPARRPRDLIRDGEADGDALTIEFRPGDEPVSAVVEVWRGDPDASTLLSLEWPERIEGASAPRKP